MGSLEFNHQVVNQKTFSGLSVSNFSATACVFTDCLFENMNIQDACFGLGKEKTKYVNCVFDNSIISARTPGIVKFEGCSFRNVKIKEMFCVDVEMVNCVFSGELESGNFVGMRSRTDGTMGINEYRNNDFSELLLKDVGFMGVDLTLQKLPSGKDFLVIHDLHSFLVRVEDEAKKLADKNLSQSIRNLVNMITMEGDGLNNQFFLDRNNFPASLKSAVDAVFSFNGK